MNEEENPVFDKIIIGIFVFCIFILTSIALMLPIINVFLAYKLFGGD